MFRIKVGVSGVGSVEIRVLRLESLLILAGLATSENSQQFILVEWTGLHAYLADSESCFALAWRPT